MAEAFCFILSPKGVLSAGQQGASLRSEAVESFPVFFFQSISISWDKTHNKIRSVPKYLTHIHAVLFPNDIQLLNIWRYKPQKFCVYSSVHR